MTELYELTKDFKVSRPVFSLTLRQDGDKIATSEPLYKYEPKPIEGNILSEMVCSAFYERFDIDSGRFTTDTEEIADRVMQDIRCQIANFLEENLEMRSPTQSKVYRWFYRSMPNDTYFNDMIVKVYKYMRQFTHSNMREIDASSGENNAQIKNIIALLEAIMEKYEKA